MDTIVQSLEAADQDHVLRFYEDLSDDQKSSLENDIRSVDWVCLAKICKNVVLNNLTEDNKLKPASKIEDDLLQELPSDCIEGTTRCNSETLQKYEKIGLDYIQQGNVAALLLAGGQGTRLGVDYPKGMFDVGLPSKKSLFQLQAERIQRVSKLSELSQANEKNHAFWYIMTSGSTMEKTKDHFSSNNYFGLNPERIVFFEQGQIPCFDFNGKVLLEQKHKISKSPDGNGGIYEALHREGIIQHMKRNGVKYLHAYCVDNILVRVCDPVYMGYCITRNADVGAKVVEKVQPNESVGTICKVGDQFKVIEYSEISDQIANKRDEASGKLLFNAGNICEHFFKVQYLESIKDDKQLRYHLAIKKIPYICLKSGQQIKPDIPNGIKLEKFIFDVFEFTDKFVAWEVVREDEFSPLKNADGSVKDNPTTARQALLRSYELGNLTS